MSGLSAKLGLGVYSIWPFFGCMAVLLLLAATPIMRAADTPPSPHRNRISTLDGLRGFLAFGVFFHHAAIIHIYLLEGKWEPPPSRFYEFLGPVGVALFFMITGYLFWTKILKQRSQLNWPRLYIERVFRIGPLYLVAVVSMLIIVGIRTGFRLQEPAGQVGREITRWLMLGLFSAPGPNVNGYPDTNYIVAGVTWTLSFEWFFYLSLPLTALAARRPKADLLFTTDALFIVMIYAARHVTPSLTAPPVICIALFLIGMSCASLERGNLLAKLPNWISSLLLAALLVMVFIAFPSANMAAPVALLGIAFYLIISGCDLFGLLTSRAACRLGNVSYGIYLLQGLVLTVVFSFHQTRTFALTSPLRHWAMILLCGMLLAATSTCTHVLVERTGIDLGRRLAGRLTTVRQKSPI